MASIGKLALQLTADASGLVKGLQGAQVAMLSTNAKMLIEATKLGKMLDGRNLVKGLNKLPEELAKQVKASVGIIKSQFPDMAKEVERQGKTLAKVMKDGSVGVAVVGKDGKVRYRNMDGASGGMFAAANRNAQQLEKQRKAEKAIRDAQIKDVEEHNKKEDAFRAKVAGKLKGWMKVAVKGAFAAAGGVGAILGNDILADARSAARLGLSINDLRGAMLLAGPAADVMGEGLGNMQMMLARARDGSLDALAAIRGLGRIGGEEISLQGGMASLADIAENLANIADPAMRAAQAFRVFGAAAVEIMPFLDQGRAGVQGAAATMQRLGLGVNENELRTVREVAVAMSTIKAAGAGLLNQIALAIAPLAAQLSTLFDTSGVNFSNVKNLILDGVMHIGTGISMVISLFSDVEPIKTAWEGLMHFLDAGWSRLQAQMTETLALVARTADNEDAAVGFERNAEQFRQLARDRARLGADIINDALEMASNSPAVRAFRGFMRDARARIAPSAPAGSGGSPLAYQAAQDARFASQLQAIRNPGEQFRESVLEMRRFQQAGMFEGEAGLRQRFAFRMFEQLRNGAGFQYRQPGAALAGSRDAYSAVVANERRNQRGDIQQQIRDLLELQRRLEEEQVRQGNEIIRALNREGLPARGI